MILGLIRKVHEIKFLNEQINFFGFKFSNELYRI